MEKAFPHEDNSNNGYENDIMLLKVTGKNCTQNHCTEWQELILLFHSCVSHVVSHKCSIESKGKLNTVHAEVHVFKI